MPGLSVLPYEDCTRKEICEHFGKTTDELDGFVDELRKWAADQKCVPQDISTHKLEFLIILNKFRLERTKSKLLSHFSLREGSKYFQDTIITSQTMQDQLELTTLIPMPTLYQNHRVFVAKVLDPCTKKFNLAEAFACLTCQADIIMEYDYHVNAIVVVDASGFNFGHIRCFSYGALSDFYNIFMEAFSGRISAIHMINVNIAVRGILYILKLVLSPKIASRMYVHRDLESLHKEVPPEYLPSDFGGTNTSIKEVLGKWKKVVEDLDPMLKKLRNISCKKS